MLVLGMFTMNVNVQNGEELLSIYERFLKMALHKTQNVFIIHQKPVEAKALLPLLQHSTIGSNSSHLRMWDIHNYDCEKYITLNA